MGDEIVSNVVGTMLEPIRDSLYKFIGDRFGYLFHCKKNIKEFAEEVDRLSLAKQGIQTRVSAASRNAEVIHDGVMEWLSKVESMEGDKTRILQGKQNLKCVDVCTRYQLGKEGKKKKTDVTKLIEDGNNFGTVGHRPPLTRTWHRTHTINYESFESRELVFNDIMEALKDDRNYKIGIHGMPGVGKTRMMEEVAKQTREDGLFDEIAKIVVSENPNLEKIQKQLAEPLDLTLDKDTEGARRELLHNRLKSDKRILVMVDDLWNDGIKLEDIGIPATCEHTKGCKILLTSRRRDVCEAMGIPQKENFQIGVLSKAEAWSLFKKKVGDSIEPREMHSIAKAVCEECAGLPLAILAVGGALKNKRSKQVWKDALKQLRNFTGENIAGLPAKLYSPIELSYNHLELVDAKSLFLLCCLFPEDAEISIEYLVRFGFGMSLLRGVDTMEEARNRTYTLVTTLKTSSLLLDANEKDRVKMHDVIRDVAISIASKDKDVMFLVKTGIEKWLEKDEYKRCRTISLWFIDDCVIPDDLECPELHTLILVLEAPSEVQCSFLKGMEKLVVLFLGNMRIATLPSSLKNLRMLHLISCQLVNLAYLKEFKKLEILSIQDNDLEELAPEIGQLTRLRLLDLNNCYSLKIVPSGVISSLSKLEELYIPGEFDQWEVEGNASLMELNSLRCLISLAVHVPNVMLLPLNELLFNSLIKFLISIGRSFEYNEIRSSATRILKLVGFPLKRELSILMEKAEELYLFELEGLKDVFHERGREGEGEGFLDLKYLKVVDCDGVEHLFGKPKLISQTIRACTSGSFSQLRVLKVKNCPSSYLFTAATARGLLQLQKLNIKDCEILEEIVRDDEEDIDTVSFQGLKKMKLERLPNLRSFFYVNMKKTSTTRCNTSTLMQALFNHKVRFPALEELKIYDLESLAAMWDNKLFLSSKGEDSFRQLRNINVRKCQKLVNVIPPNAFLLLQDLEILEVKECDSMVSGVEVVATKEGGDEIVIFPRLKIMRLENLPNLKSFCWSRSGGEYRILEGNNILQRQALFNHKVRFPALEELKIYDLESLTEMWDNELFLSSKGEDSFRRLRNINVRKCQKLVNVLPPNAFPLLQNLEILEVTECDSMVSGVEVVATKEGGDEIVIFPRLKIMRLENLPNLKSFCWSRSGGEDRILEGNNILQQRALFNHKVKFPCLESLYILELDNLKEIWPNTTSNESVPKKLSVRGCHKLLNVGSTKSLTSFQTLEELIVAECDSLQEVFKVEEMSSSKGAGAEGSVESDKAIIGKEVENINNLVFPRLAKVVFEELPCLTSFYGRRNCISELPS